MLVKKITTDTTLTPTMSIVISLVFSLGELCDGLAVMKQIC